ncbi:uncharacterized protein LOC141651639 [Silene latifolia]|uniref:uncharacterized protein LOC141651639 n=1 Tax=Silene latifolia TaxID=37657 RepID=UPI003D771D59
MDIFGLLETHVKEHNAHSIFKKFPNYRILTNYQNHYNGRIWVFWNPNTITMVNTDTHAQVIHCGIIHNATNHRLDVSFVYGCNTAHGRESLWTELIRISTLSSNWLISGDFNIVRHASEKTGPNPPKISEVMAFNDCLRTCHLDDLSSTGCEFSWTNKHHDGTRVWSRLDRALINPLWLQTFPNSNAVVLLPGLSDHSPILVNVFEDQKFRKQFSFLDCWTEHPHYQTCVTTGWTTQCKGSPIYKFFKKLASVRKHLSLLHQQDYNGLSQRVLAAAQKLASCPAGSSTISPIVLFFDEAHLIQVYASLQKAELSMLHQRAKIHGIKMNDCSSKYFFAKIAKRKQQSIVGQICNQNGLTVHGVDEASLCLPITALEIKKALFSIGNQKSPGYDGFSSGFYKSAWSVVGDDFIQAVQSFFKTGKLAKQANVTVLTLIPKKDVVTSVKDFRPIACCTVLYKTISKVLVARLKPLLQKLIGPEQGAFVDKRNIFENIMLSQALIKGYNNGTCSPRTMIKVDIKKAFDSVQWQFVSSMLKSLNFPDQFVHWIMGCISSTWFTLKINGSNVGFFKGAGGLRQGDPLSPYLFVLGMEILSRYLRPICSLHYVTYHPKCARIKLNHLIFADDLMIFVRGDVPSVKAVAHTLDLFGSISGNYLWQTTMDKHKLYMKSWQSCCCPWDEGGFHIKEILSWNSANICKWIWKMQTSSESLWVLWNHAYNVKSGTIGMPLSNLVIRKLEKYPHTRDLLLTLYGTADSAAQALQTCVSPNGHFMVSKAYDLLRPHYPKNRWAKAIWSPNVLPKHSFITALAAQGKLPTVDNLCRRGLYLVGCVFLEGLQISGRSCFGVGTGTVVSIGKWPVCSLLCLIACVYMIWQERNTRIFTGKESGVQGLLRQVQFLVSVKMLARNVKNSNMVIDHLSSIYA